MRDVATLAGVSKQTVSNVLSGRGKVRSETGARVRRPIDQLGYVPNLVARSLATGSTQTVGLIVPTVASPFYSEVVEEVENVLDALLIAGDRSLIDHVPLLRPVLVARESSAAPNAARA